MQSGSVKSAGLASPRGNPACHLAAPPSPRGPSRLAPPRISFSSRMQPRRANGVAFAASEFLKNVGLLTAGLAATPTLLTTSPVALPGLAALAAVLLRAGKQEVQHATTHLPQQPQAAAFHTMVLSRCNTIKAEYKPAFAGLMNGYTETIVASQMRHVPEIPYQRECLRMEDGGTVALDWAHHPTSRVASHAVKDPFPEDAPVLILLSGLGGGSHDHYVRHNVEQATARGFRVVVCNSRGTADSPVTSAKFFSAAYTGDLEVAVAHVAAKYPRAPLLAAGWSLGANLLVKYLGEQGARSPIKAAVSMCNPFDLCQTSANISSGLGRFFDAALASSLRTMLLKNMHVWEGHTGPERHWEIEGAQSLRHLEEAITVQSFGYSSVDDYYAEGSCVHGIPKVHVPLLCLQALDDPIAPKEAIPYQSLAANPHCVLVTTPSGGHIGWMAGEGAPWGHAWSDAAALEWLESVMLELKVNKEEKVMNGSTNRESAR